MLHVLFAKNQIGWKLWPGWNIWVNLQSSVVTKFFLTFQNFPHQREVLKHLAWHENDTNVISECVQNIKKFEIEDRRELKYIVNMILRGTLGAAGPHKSDLGS